VKDTDFWVDFIAGNLNKLAKLGSEGKKFSWVLNVFTLNYGAFTLGVRDSSVESPKTVLVI